MLIRYNIENFSSINKEIEFSLIANKERRKSFHLIKYPGINILKIAVLYGANASGKSNLVKSIAFAQKIILHGVKSIDTINKHFRLSKSNINKPTKFEFEIKVDDKFYSYGFGIILNKKIIVEEWLHEIGKNKEIRVFERYLNNTGEHIVDIGKKLPKNDKNRFKVYKQDFLFSDELLFLSEICRKNLKDIKIVEDFYNVYNWFKNTLTILFPDSKYKGINFIGDNTKMSKTFSNFLDVFRTGIDGIITKKIDLDKFEIPEEIKIELTHELKNNEIRIFEINGIRYSLLKDKNDNFKVKKIGLEHKTLQGKQVVFDIEDESDGTQRLFDFIPALFSLANSNKVFIIDELDRSLHSKLVKGILELFLRISKNRESQMIVTTHESLLLDLDFLRRDEIWFIENEGKESKIYSLDEFKVRNDKKIQKDYLLGRYGGIPIFKDFDNIEL
jgi:AAA15 family ATPase/GTPase